MEKPYVIDADGHVIEPLGMWKDHTESRYHSRLPRPVTDENGLFCYVVDDVYLMRTASRPSTQRQDASPRKDASREEGDYPEAIRPGGWDPSPAMCPTRKRADCSWR